PSRVQIPRPPPRLNCTFGGARTVTGTREHAAAFAQLGSATLGESGGHPMAPRLRAAWLGAHISAPAYPVTCAAGDNLAIHVAVAEAPAGHVLVASVGAEPQRGY